MLPLEECHLSDNNIEITNKSFKIGEKLEKYKNKLKNGTKGFFQHLMSFVFVNGFLFFLNITTSPKNPWFLYPLGAWAIGLVSHFFVMEINKKQLHKLEKMSSDITEEQLILIMKIDNIETGLYGHIGPFISTNAYLFMIYAINSFGGYPWFLFPLVGWGFGLFMHFITAIPNLADSRKKLKNTDLSYIIDAEEKSAGNFGNGKNYGNDKNVISEFKPKIEENRNAYLQALKIKNSLMKKIGSNQIIKEKIDQNIEQNITNYIDHIRQLILRDEEISGIIETISSADIGKQIDILEKKSASTNNEDLKREYKKSIEKYTRHKDSYEQLLNQKEMIKLKISSSIMSLKQLELDIASMKEIITSEDNYSLRIFEEQSEELNRYINSLKSSYQVLKSELE